MSARLGFCPAADAARARGHLKAVGLPTDPADVPGVAWDADELIGHMAKDKKVTGGRLTFVLARRIGDAFTTRDVEAADVRALLRDAIAGPPHPAGPEG